MGDEMTESDAYLYNTEPFYERLNMKVEFSKTIYHSLLIQEEDLRSICSFVSSRFKNLKIIASCMDGSRFESEDINEILLFDNPKFRRIKSIRVEGDSGSREQISVDIDSDRFSTASIFLLSESDDQAVYISREILNMLAEMKPSYHLLARIPVSGVLAAFWVAWTTLYTASMMLGFVHPSISRFSGIQQLNISIVLAIIFFVVTYPFDRLQRYLFPKVFFLLGKQKKAMETIKQWRSFIFYGLLLSIITGIVSSLIVDSLN